VKNGVTVIPPIKSNPSHGWIQSMFNSDPVKLVLHQTHKDDINRKNVTNKNCKLSRCQLKRQKVYLRVKRLI